MRTCEKCGERIEIPIIPILGLISELGAAHTIHDTNHARRHLRKGAALKEIFIGSSKEALEQATQVVAVLSEVKDVKPLLWTDCFKLGLSLSA